MECGQQLLEHHNANSVSWIGAHGGHHAHQALNWEYALTSSMHCQSVDIYTTTKLQREDKVWYSYNKSNPYL